MRYDTIYIKSYNECSIPEQIDLDIRSDDEVICNSTPFDTLDPDSCRNMKNFISH